jgi:hypothetical protein
MCDSPDQAPDHTLGAKLGASSLTWHLSQSKCGNYVSTFNRSAVYEVKQNLSTNTVQIYSPYKVQLTLKTKVNKTKCLKIVLQIYMKFSSTLKRGFL